MSSHPNMPTSRMIRRSNLTTSAPVNNTLPDVNVYSSFQDFEVLAGEDDEPQGEPNNIPSDMVGKSSSSISLSHQPSIASSDSSSTARIMEANKYPSEYLARQRQRDAKLKRKLRDTVARQRLERLYAEQAADEISEQRESIRLPFFYQNREEKVFGPRAPHKTRGRAESLGQWHSQFAADSYQRELENEHIESPRLEVDVEASVVRMGSLNGKRSDPEQRRY